RDLFVSVSAAACAAHGGRSDPAPARDASSRVDVSRARRGLSRPAAAIRRARGLWRLRRGGAPADRARRRDARLIVRPAAGRAVQRLGYARPDPRDRARDALRRLAHHGAGLLDPGLLGAGAARDARDRVRAARKEVVGEDVTLVPGADPIAPD